ncbi:MAG: class F sortase [Clostridiales bacterium]|nr:class F sortase [Clostridiales bacterium]
MQTICPITNERCPYQKKLVNGVCEDQLTCPIIDVSFRKMKKKSRLLSEKTILISFYSLLIILLFAFIYVFFFTNLITLPKVNESSSTTSPSPSPSETEEGFLVYIDKEIDEVTPYENNSLPLVPLSNEKASKVVRIKIDSLSLFALVESVSLNQYNLIETYPDKSVVSWYEGSHLPSEKGNCILVGNKYYNSFAAVFNQLDNVAINDQIIFTLDNGTTIVQTIYDIVIYNSTILPESIFKLDGSYPITTIISKTGNINKETGEYDSFIVVLAH